MWSWLTRMFLFSLVFLLFHPLKFTLQTHFPFVSHFLHPLSVLLYIFYTPFILDLFCPFYPPPSPHTSLFSGCFRGVSHLLAAFLCDSHSEHPLQDMLRAPCTLRSVHLAGVCQQCSQPCYLHHLQHWVQTSLHQDPELLKEPCREIKMQTCTAQPGALSKHWSHIDPALCPIWLVLMEQGKVRDGTDVAINAHKWGFVFFSNVCF